MTPHYIFILFVLILVFNFALERFASYLNSKHFNDAIPEDLKGVYTQEKYKKSQQYKLVNYKFGLAQSTFSFVLLMLFIFLNGFKWLDEFVRQFSDNSLVISMLFFGVIFIASTLISIPFSYYHTFTIEERFGFNKMTKILFIKDTLKSIVLTLIIGGGVLVVILWFYQLFPDTFWLYTWLFIAVFSLFMNLFYTKLIVPIFNKLTPLRKRCS